ncbi:uncharacterized protein LOC142352849 [Convolutriloba macropyga]|uniref:uncharacterized protein LOC142352849 n=1 Tax=Convolutriloba macropyga TaxID=536237 RepID=UPI003F5226B9
MVKYNQEHLATIRNDVESMLNSVCSAQEHLGSLNNQVLGVADDHERNHEFYEKNPAQATEKTLANGNGASKKSAQPKLIGIRLIQQIDCVLLVRQLLHGLPFRIYPQDYDPLTGRIILSTSTEIFFLDPCLGLSSTERLTIPSGWFSSRTIESVACSSNGILYLLQKSVKKYIVSVVERSSRGTTLRVIREVDSSVYTDCRIETMNNRLFVIEKLAITKHNKHDTVDIRIYESERIIRLLRTEARDVNQIVVTSEFILYINGGFQIEIQSTENDVSDKVMEFQDIESFDCLKTLFFMPESAEKNHDGLFICFLWKYLFKQL